MQAGGVGHIVAARLPWLLSKVKGGDGMLGQLALPHPGPAAPLANQNKIKSTFIYIAHLKTTQVDQSALHIK